MSRYEIEVLPNGVWRNPSPDYVIFNDQIKSGEHSCPTCKCSFCQAPSIYNVIHATHTTDGRSAGLMYCLDCCKREYGKVLKKEQQMKQDQAKQEQAKQEQAKQDQAK